MMRMDGYEDMKAVVEGGRSDSKNQMHALIYESGRCSLGVKLSEAKKSINPRQQNDAKSIRLNIKSSTHN